MQGSVRESKSLRKYSNIASNIKGSPEQITAISLFSGPSQIVAGPGAGKTFVLVNHIDYLIRHYRVDPYSILVLTFSKASALEMNERYLKMPYSSSGVSFGTFHSVFFHILKNSERINYSLIDGKKKIALIQTLLSVYFPKSDESDISVLSDIISAYKTNGSIRLCGRFDEEKPIKEAIRHYDSYLDNLGLLDFDDMLIKCLKLLETRPDIRKAWQERFRFILVDEFQDINSVQYRILELLSKEEHNLFVVGDDDQSIYGFRGAGPGIMQRFAADHPDTKRIFLSRNYRCHSKIVDAAGKVIIENTNRIPKKITAVNCTDKDENSVVILPFESIRLEYDYICGKLLKMSEDERRNCAVIFRTHLQAQQFSRVLKTNGIEFFGETVHNSRNDIETLKDIHAYYKMAIDLNKGAFSRSDYYRVMNKPDRYLGRESGKSHFLSPEILLSGIPASSKAGRSIAELIKDLKALYELPPGYSIKYLLYSMRYAEWSIQNSKSEPADALKSLFEKITDMSGRMHTCEEFLISISALIDQYERSNSEKTTGTDMGVRVMTMHAVKGLEYDHVFIPDINEGILPNRRAVSNEQTEEERRLFYVAMTRAREKLELLYLEGNAENPRKPSRFLLPLGIRPWQN